MGSAGVILPSLLASSGTLPKSRFSSIERHGQERVGGGGQKEPLDPALGRKGRILGRFGTDDGTDKTCGLGTVGRINWGGEGVGIKNQTPAFAVRLPPSLASYVGTSRRAEPNPKFEIRNPKEWENGGSGGARTRNLCRDRAAL